MKFTRGVDFGGQVLWRFVITHQKLASSLFFPPNWAGCLPPHNALCTQVGSSPPPALMPNPGAECGVGACPSTQVNLGSEETKRREAFELVDLQRKLLLQKDDEVRQLAHRGPSMHVVFRVVARCS